MTTVSQKVPMYSPKRHHKAKHKEAALPAAIPGGLFFGGHFKRQFHTKEAPQVTKKNLVYSHGDSHGDDEISAPSHSQWRGHDEE